MAPNNANVAEQAATVTHVKLSMQLVSALTNYLASRPFSEAEPYINTLRNELRPQLLQQPVLAPVANEKVEEAK